VACGPSRVRGGLHAGLLFVAPGLSIEQTTLVDNDERITIFIPEEYQNLPAPQWAANVTLETVEAP